MNRNKRIIITQHKIGGLVQKHVSNGVTPPLHQTIETMLTNSSKLNASALANQQQYNTHEYVHNIHRNWKETSVINRKCQLSTQG